MLCCILCSALYDEFYGDTPIIHDDCILASDGAIRVAYEHIHCRKYKNQEITFANEEVKLQGYAAELPIQQDRHESFIWLVFVAVLFVLFAFLIRRFGCK